ncbi:5-formyltetrahydrofolate cyclo-ligase [Methylobacterium sp. 4-46]|uniref:5-formyltetrahydrofolate cyclo-ligase n=1 Tax=unclassified Methylobacterium TaxID=2615210 RepID=UPI000152D17F|nr:MULTISPECIES: 5-formyltetrahydrofolate cyclo-ligase [Methylobacterium]ACA17318.1 5-formyltetrahydrofolate cyclo-ligase [Methylobacterium sp. 4-46]WFT83003.1 5-formyltetrahydrofolate cyclo-ligase [Methylobacterium nodulans]
MSDTSKISDANTGLPNAGADWPTIRDWRKETRTKLIEQRIGLSAQDRAARSQRVSQALGAALEPYAGKLIGFYWPFRGEYDPRAVLSSMRERGTRLALPVIVERGQPLVFREWSPGRLMAQGVWNIPVPESGEPVFPDLLVVPLVGFDEQGYRLGYGGGFYDRTIAAMSVKPRTIGVGFELGRVRTIYPQPHDIALEEIVTER